MGLFDLNDEDVFVLGSDEDSISTVEQMRPTITVFVLADTSRSMIIDGNINKLNSALHELRPQLLHIQGADAQVRIAIYTFGKECMWRTRNAMGDPDAVPIDEFVWNDVQPAGQTPLGCALKELNLRLSRNGFIRTGETSYAPVILLITDDAPTDDWQEPMEALQNNGWFANGIRIAIGPEEAREQVLARFTGDTRSVLEFPGSGMDTADKLTQMIVRMVVHASRISTQTRSMAQTRTPVEIGVQVSRDVFAELETVDLGELWGQANEDGFAPNGLMSDEAEEADSQENGKDGEGYPSFW